MDHLQKNICRTVDTRKNNEIVTPTKNKRIKMSYGYLIIF